ncbi:hypothetical protein AX15_004751 [Amanita polypyramis BW_CC]|nr:hypothetical protein AX15_004751 [Amanita polypyramis BW_CC]
MALNCPLDAIPHEVLEHIAFHAANGDFLGPPSGLIPLISLNRRTYTQLSLASNVHLYAKIFAAKFDTAAAKRRLGPERTVANVLALELQRRCFYLKRLRAQVDARYTDASSDSVLQDLLFHVYLMMLENDGKNERQLREYGRIEPWLKIYWFDESGSSLATSSIHMEKWPVNDTNLSIAMWLHWFFVKLDDLDDTVSMMHVLRVFALSAHQYHLSLYPWADFLPTRSRSASKITYYSRESQLEPVPLATPAILSFLTLVNKVAEDSAYPSPLTPSAFPLITNNSLEWECEWGRCINIGERERVNFLSNSFKSGSIDGVWEGFFTYTEFAAYAALLAGAPPNILHKSMVVRHRQTWKLREYHLLDEASLSNPSNEMNEDTDYPQSLSPGDPLHSYLPVGTKIEEGRDRLHVQEPGKRHILQYHRASSHVTRKSGDALPDVKDIIITGEGHSAWGQFNLIGRVRPYDGFISISKEYVVRERGRWLYRGYLVGDVNGNLAGRWRDTFSPVEMPGYEGCFVMSHRR